MIQSRKQVLLPINQLIGATYNPRTITEEELQKLDKSLRIYGFVEPVVARAEDYMIIGGHQRVESRRRIARVDGEDLEKVKVPVILIAGLSDDEARALNLALNRISGEWEWAKLAEIFDSFAPDFDIALSGFDAPEIRDVLRPNYPRSSGSSSPSTSTRRRISTASWRSSRRRCGFGCSSIPGPSPLPRWARPSMWMPISRGFGAGSTSPRWWLHPT